MPGHHQAAAIDDVEWELLPQPIRGALQAQGVHGEVLLLVMVAGLHQGGVERRAQPLRRRRLGEDVGRRVQLHHEAQGKGPPEQRPVEVGGGQLVVGLRQRTFR